MALRLLVCLQTVLYILGLIALQLRRTAVAQSYNCQCGQVCCRVEPELPCRVTEAADSVCQTPLDNRGIKQGKPENLEAHVHELDDKPYLNISWTAPRVSYMGITGFSLELSNPRFIKCFHVNLTGTQWAAVNDRQTVRFRYDCMELEWSTEDYIVLIRSLPRSDSAFTQVFSTPRRNTPVPPVPSAWEPEITKDLHPDTHTIIANFTTAPLAFKFVQYSVMLQHKESGEYSVQSIGLDSKDDKFRIVVFHNVCKQGSYRLLVKATASSNEECDMCLTMYGLCEECRYTSTPLFKCIPEARVTTDKTSTKLWTKVSFIGGALAIGIFLAVAVTLLLRVLGCRLAVCRRGPRGSSDDVAFLTEKKTVLILYSPDLQQHRDAIVTFANLLHTASCEVIFDLWEEEEINQSITRWLSCQIYKASKIIIVNSEGAYRKFRCPETFEYVSIWTMIDTFLMAFNMTRNNCTHPSEREHFLKKVMMVYMPYTKQHFMIDYVFGQKSRPNYNVVDDLDKIILRIHDLSLYAPGFRFCLASNYSSSEKESLTKAIQKMATVVDREPDWFENNHRKITKSRPGPPS